MEKFQIGDIIFDPHNRLLANKLQQRALEPKVCLLLQVLIAAKGEVVTRDQLIMRVWAGRVVGDGAINRTISLLRQHFAALEPDVLFVETVAKAGYRFIQSVANTDVNNEPAKPQITQYKQTKLVPVLVIIMLLLCVLFAGYYWLKPAGKLTQYVGHSERLIALSGIEFNLSATANGDQLLYLQTQNDSSNATVYLQHRTNESAAVKLIEDSGVVSATISEDGQFVAFSSIKQGRCQLNVLAIASGRVETLRDCSIDSVVQFSWHPDNRTLFFRHRDSKTQPYSIWRYHTESQALAQITKPPATGNTLGDYQLSHHPEQNLVAVLRYVESGVNELMLVNSISGETIQTHQLDYSIADMDWHSDGDAILLASEQQLITLNPTTGERTSIATIGKTIQSLVVADRDILFTDLQIASEIWQFDINSQQQQAVYSSAAIAQMPVISTNGKLLFTSKIDKKVQLMVRDNVNKTIQPVSLPVSWQFLRPQWQRDANIVWYAHHGAIYQTYIDTGNSVKLLDESAKAYVVNMTEDNRVIYSSERSGQWQLWLLDPETGVSTQLTTTGGYSGQLYQGKLIFSKFTQNGLWQLDLDTGEEQRILDDFNLINWLNWQIVADYLYFYRPSDGIWRLHLPSMSTERVMAEPDKFIHQYSVSEQGVIYYIKRTQLAGDIYKLAE